MPQLDFNVAFFNFILIVVFFIIFYLFIYFFILRKIMKMLIVRKFFDADLNNFKNIYRKNKDTYSTRANDEKKKIIYLSKKSNVN